MSEVATQLNTLGDWLKGECEIPQLYSREVVTLLAGSGSLKSGQVLALVSATGKHIPLDTNVSAGEPAAAILLLDSAVNDNSSDDVEATAIVRMATIDARYLVWPTGVSAGTKTTALAALKAVGIVEREGA